MSILEKPQEPKMPETKDISKKGLVALVLLTVVISLIGSFLVLNEISRSQVLIHDEKPAVGSAQLGVYYPKDNASPKPVSTGSTGYATLQIQKKPNVEIKKSSTIAVTNPVETKQEIKKAHSVPSQNQNSNSKLYYYEDRGVNNGYFE
ncbi:MAG: hypothetical protein AABX70_01455 [Nanoarchaeota archaeon]